MYNKQSLNRYFLHMKKLLLLLVCFFCIHITNAQYNATELKLKTGEILQVLGKLKGNHHFKYKKYNRDKPVKIHFSEIDYVKIQMTRRNTETYKYVKVAGEQRMRVLQETMVGDVSLYLHSEDDWQCDMNGFSQWVTYTDYYVKRSNETEAVHLPNGLFAGPRFREIASDFFQDCEALVEKIQTKEFKVRHISDIVNFYNLECD